MQIIPKKFATKYRSDISSPVFLEVPSRAVWKVELKTCADKTWLCNGWPEFAKDCSLGRGSFLVFRYEGNSHFHVIIFDKTASEIAYPYGRTHGKVLNSAGFQDDDDESVEILDEVPLSRKSPSLSSGGHQDLMMDDDHSVEFLDEVPPSKQTRVKSPSTCSWPRKMTRSTSNIKPPKINCSRVKYEIPQSEFNGMYYGLFLNFSLFHFFCFLSLLLSWPNREAIVIV